MSRVMPPAGSSTGKGRGRGRGAGKGGGSPASEPLTPHADAPNTVLSHGNFERIFNLFLGSATISDPSLKAKAGNTFAEMPEEVACNQAIYNYFATYLVYTYVIGKGSVGAGNPLDHTSAKVVWSGVINLAKVKWCEPGACSNPALLVSSPPFPNGPPPLLTRVSADRQPLLRNAGVLRLLEGGQQRPSDLVPRHPVQDGAHHLHSSGAPDPQSPIPYPRQARSGARRLSARHAPTLTVPRGSAGEQGRE